MKTNTAVKICGISTPQTLEAAVQNGARFVGFVFYPPSPRHLSFDTAWTLARAVPTGVRSVGLFVDPTNETLNHILGGVQLDMIQLHGDETPARIVEIKNQYNMPVIKAIRVHDARDLDDVHEYEAVADWLLFDAKPPNADLPGGTGHSFDWTILKDKTFSKPWMLSGGLVHKNVADAVSLLHPDAVDVSSGVESTRGIKDIEKIEKFILEVKSND